MPIRPCPECQHQPLRLLEAASKSAWVNYYRCDECGHLWTVPKDQPEAALTDMILRRQTG